MNMVAQRIASAVLHVADKLVLPVHHIERSIGCELKIHGTEIGIGRNEQVLAVVALVTRAVVFQRVLLDAEEADGVAEQEVALHVVGEMAAGDEL